MYDPNYYVDDDEPTPKYRRTKIVLGFIIGALAVIEVLMWLM